MAYGTSCIELYIFWILHQTTTISQLAAKNIRLYIFWILHQTTTRSSLCLHFPCCISFESYIKPQLFGERVQMSESCISFESYIKPQPLFDHTSDRQGCISFESYIKPQLWLLNDSQSLVVYLLNPTSNHNWQVDKLETCWLYIFWILHQTTTVGYAVRFYVGLYIFWILHQTTTTLQ